MHRTTLVDSLVSHHLPMAVDMNDKVRICRSCVPCITGNKDMGNDLNPKYRMNLRLILLFLNLFSGALCDQLFPPASSLYTGMPFSKTELDAICKPLTPWAVSALPCSIIANIAELEYSTMALRNAVLANEHLRKVLTEAEVPNLEGQVDFDLTDRRGWGSFGDVYMGQYNGIVSSTTCLSAGGTVPKCTSAERLC